METASLHQSFGHKRFGKISPDRCGYGCDFSKPFLLQNLAASRPFPFRFSGLTEAGCKQYEPFIDGNTFIMLERWASQAALDKHLEQEHMKLHIPQLRECVVGGVFEAQFIQTDAVKVMTF